MKQADYLTVIQTINELRSEVRNWQETQKSTAWKWSCVVCGDSRRDLHKARFGITRKGSDFVCNCFNCGYANNFVAYLRSFHPDKYEKISVETIKQNSTTFCLDDVVSKVTNKTATHLFFINKTSDRKSWLNILIDKKIALNKNNIKKLITIHENYWRNHGNH